MPIVIENTLVQQKIVKKLLDFMLLGSQPPDIHVAMICYGTAGFLKKYYNIRRRISTNDIISFLLLSCCYSNRKISY